MGEATGQGGGERLSLQFRTREQRRVDEESGEVHGTKGLGPTVLSDGVGGADRLARQCVRLHM